MFPEREITSIDRVRDFLSGKPIVALLAAALASVVAVFASFAGNARFSFLVWLSPLVVSIGGGLFANLRSKTFRIETTEFEMSHNTLKEGDAAKIKKALSE
jgi:hypothetical protein